MQSEVVVWRVPAGAAFNTLQISFKPTRCPLRTFSLPSISYSLKSAPYMPRGITALSPSLPRECSSCVCRTNPPATAAYSSAPRRATCCGGNASPPAQQVRQWRSTPPARGRTVHRKLHPGSPRLLDGGRGSPSCFAPGKVPLSSPRSRKLPSYEVAASCCY